MQQYYLKKCLKESEIAILSDRTGKICKISPFGANHGGALWVTKLMEPMYNDQPLYQSLLSFQSSRFSNMTKKWQKPEYLENEKSFWGEIKTIWFPHA